MVEEGAAEGAAGNLSAVVRNRALRRVLLAFAIFRPTESAQWIAILVYAYRDGGTRAMGIAAITLLVPATLLAPFVAQLGDRIHRERALALSYLVQGVTAGLTAAALTLDLPSAAVYASAIVLNVAITATRPTHLSILPELAETPAQLTAATGPAETATSAIGTPITTTPRKNAGANRSRPINVTLAAAPRRPPTPTAADSIPGPAGPISRTPKARTTVKTSKAPITIV